ncbi:tumor necrosis factor receptor superfamily member 6B-like isoform X1 [Amphiprion ocellaris]|uniref:TNFR-Cys domain-containing protein n=1 Tax=Amphiprion ocellaris TaxID=80972 RepID=A0A3Q1C1J9_AMPOC|nr:tumor necrosis factor receptor superfamily member 6B-like isoform X1 [Amphiprion ocellaris]
MSTDLEHLGRTGGSSVSQAKNLQKRATRKEQRRSKSAHGFSPKMPMLLLPALLLLLSGLRTASADEPVPTYQHRDPVTGETLTCTKCPPGTHMAAHCTASTPTQCAPCRPDYFTALWNYLPRCLYCNNFCNGNQEVETECSPTTNRVCRCQQGFYGLDDFCMPHSQCGPGHGVLTKGTLQTDTVCARCSDGYFSTSFSALDSCIKHQECTNEKIELLGGSADQDTMCGTCEELANGGETFRTFLSGFFTLHKMRVGKMKKFVARHIRSAEERPIQDTTKQRGPLLDQIRVWLSKAPEEELRKLPQMLKDSQLGSMAEKLQTRLSEIKQQSPNCTLFVV